MSDYENQPPRQKAVALGYDMQEDDAPKVVATGEGHIAQQIIAIAQEHGIHVRKDKELVEILSHLEVDTIIPLEAYTAVAEILSYVYRVNSDLKGQDKNK